ncbi:hypothetical protein [Streptomyces sp. BK340]|uniref:hypothetical protein n=1 Tax=Streptomyces sp. BK340 TaxID=2572903 RepID=UPI0021BD6541|nr:hypothetical protein [Streptomyces sp. BK340]
MSVLVALSGCSGGDGSSQDKDKGNQTAAAVPSTTKPASADPEAAEKTAVLQAYDSYWNEQVKAYTRADIKGTGLKKYATERALTRAMGDLLVMQKAGTATTGRPGHKVEVTSLTLTGKIPKASLRDCLDISNWKTVKRNTGQVKPFPPNQPLRYLTTVSAEKWGKQWMITDAAPDGTKTC